MISNTVNLSCFARDARSWCVHDEVGLTVELVEPQLGLTSALVPSAAWAPGMTLRAKGARKRRAIPLAGRRRVRLESVRRQDGNDD
jgi:hypothetical protein